MRYKYFTHLTHLIGLIIITFLTYWVFGFISITVFDLQVFSKDIAQTFYFSVFGLGILLLGVFCVNVMLNLTRIAEGTTHGEAYNTKSMGKKGMLIFLLTFPVLLGGLFIGDHLTARKKEDRLTASAGAIIESNPQKSERLLYYTFTESWILEAKNILERYSRTDRQFPYVSVIVADTIEAERVFLSFRDYYGNLQDTVQPKKKEFLYATNPEERAYLEEVYNKNSDKMRFSSQGGKYELFYPYAKEGKKIVLYFSDAQLYGRVGNK